MFLFVSQFSLEDEITKNVEVTKDLWAKVGEQFLEEEASRDRRVKDQIDFPFEQPKHYPDKGK